MAGPVKGLPGRGAIIHVLKHLAILLIGETIEFTDATTYRCQLSTKILQ